MSANPFGAPSAHSGHLPARGISSCGALYQGDAVAFGRVCASLADMLPTWVKEVGSYVS